MKYSSLLTLVVASQFSVCAFAGDGDHSSHAKTFKHTFDAKEFRTTSVAECGAKINHVIQTFKELEKSVSVKIKNKENQSLLLPWLKEAAWHDFTHDAWIDIKSIDQTSAALVKKDVQSPDENTPYTRFEDFKVSPDAAKDAGGFQLTEVVDRICEGKQSTAISRVGTNGFYYDQYKFDILAQASLFNHYLGQTTENITKAGKLEEFSADLKKIKESLEDFKAFALERRKAKVL